MILIYMHPDCDWVAVREDLQARGLRFGSDFVTLNYLCFRVPDDRAAVVYTNQTLIKTEYERLGVKVNFI